MKIELSKEQLYLIQLALCSYEHEFYEHTELLKKEKEINTSRIAEYEKTQNECNDLFCYIHSKIDLSEFMGKDIVDIYKG